LPRHARHARLTGALFCAVAAVAFSGKAVIIKLVQLAGAALVLAGVLIVSLGARRPGEERRV